jgi:transposase
VTATRTAVPKAGDGIVEAIRALRVARRGAVKARTQTTNQLKSLLVTAPSEVRKRLQDLKTPVLVAACARLRSSGPLGLDTTSAHPAIHPTRRSALQK